MAWSPHITRGCSLHGPSVSETPRLSDVGLQGLHPSVFVTFRNRSSRPLCVAIGQPVGGGKVGRIWTSLSSSLFSFFTKPLLSLFICNRIPVWETFWKPVRLYSLNDYSISPLPSAAGFSLLNVAMNTLASRPVLFANRTFLWLDDTLYSVFHFECTLPFNAGCVVDSRGERRFWFLLLTVGFHLLIITTAALDTCNVHDQAVLCARLVTPY